ncbi:tetratricopeptide repeat protein [Parafrankia sp. FMc6]|uniref:tetratricopeptide repeat protein n=1 Tax=Parafrankia soli TaxID=2599596 RepID=UPI0034D3DA95
MKRRLGGGASRARVLAGLVCVAGLTGAAVLAMVGPPLVRDDSGHGVAPTPTGAAAVDEAWSSAGRAAAAPVASLRDRLDQVPGDWPAWAELGLAYVEQARVTGDPTSYPRADGAFARSLELRSVDNDAALAGQAALAAARHDFPGALRAANAAVAVNPFNATAHGVRFDALVELGRYPEAWQAAQTAVDLRPDVASLARVAYAFELRGEIDQAAAMLRRVADDATSAADAAFAYFHLGELARHSGDLVGADEAYRRGQASDPSSVSLLVGRARVAAARGENEAALADYAVAATRSPQPWIVAEYGELLESLGRPDEAKRQYSLVRSTAELMRAQGVEVDVELALFEADHGDPAAALAALSPAPGGEPHRAGVFVDDARAWVLHQLGRDDEALPSAESALGLGTRRALFSYHRGVVHAALGRTDAAVADLRAALDTDPHFSPLHAPRAHALLASLDASAR